MMPDRPWALHTPYDARRPVAVPGRIGVRFAETTVRTPIETRMRSWIDADAARTLKEDPR